MAKSPAHSTPVVHVALDTNVLFTDAEDKLLNEQTSSFILSEAKSLGLDVRWYIPAVVRGERRRQMVERGSMVFRHLEKFETLLGLKVGITPEFLGAKIDEIIEREMESHHLAQLELDTSKVGWERIIRSAVEKKPPFSAGESEKGFKDAVIAEGFVQLAESTLKSPEAARVVFVCRDELLRTYAQGRVSDRKNVRVVASLEDLRSILNAIASDISQEVIDKIIMKARAMFFEKDKQGHLYGKWDIGTKILNHPATKRPPESGFAISNKKPWIGSTAFTGKTGQTVSFATEVWVESEASKYTSPNLGYLPTVDIDETSTYKLALERLQLDQAASLLKHHHLPLLGTYPLEDNVLLSTNYDDILKSLERVIKRGRHVFSVVWSATFTQHGNLTKPVFAEIKEKSTTWA